MDPFKANQSAMANYAFETGAFNLKYTGRFTELIGPLDLGFDAKALKYARYGYARCHNSRLRPFG